MKKLFALSLIIYAMFSTSFSFSQKMQISQRMQMRRNVVTEVTDDFNGKKTKWVIIPTSDIKSLTESSIGMALSNDSTYILYSYIYKKDWVFVNKMYVKIDGVMFEIESMDSKRKIEEQGYISEFNYYLPTEEFIEAFKNAKTIEYRLSGNEGYITFTVKESKLAVINEFFN